MHKILFINDNKEVAFSLPRGEVLSSKDFISRMAMIVGAEVSIDDIIRADKFSNKYTMSKLILIINEEGLSFLPDHYFINK